MKGFPSRVFLHWQPLLVNTSDQWLFARSLLPTATVLFCYPLISALMMSRLMKQMYCHCFQKLFFLQRTLSWTSEFPLKTLLFPSHLLMFNIKYVIWFNPVVWLFKSCIFLNFGFHSSCFPCSKIPHEYVVVICSRMLTLTVSGINSMGQHMDMHTRLPHNRKHLQACTVDRLHISYSSEG